ncbi:disease resistance protein RGA5-like [Triticum urartu]|uniref:disease resistance protein RGA5-like n=1 Tax=Triticum urartu TaxID=4572 RepID=UPI002043B746|nr:disease resistance protein RGA5-like [Triticum urartu]
MEVGTGVMASLLPKLDELLNEKYKLQTSIREDVEYLSREMKSMHAALRKVAEVPPDQLHKQDKLWAGEARQMSYNMEVLLDKLLMGAPNSDGSMGHMEKKCNWFKKGKLRHEIGDTIKHIKSHIREIDRQRDRHRDSDVTNCRGPFPCLRAMYTAVPQLVGIDGEKYQELMKLLSDGDNVPSKKLKIVSVVGFAGLGKTTLVKTVYDKIKSGFDCGAFVSASQNADVKKVLLDIILHLDMNGSQLNTLDEQRLITKLGELLENKRYLIVIDDIWNENLWGNIKHAFSNKNNLGSRIITTTRIVSVSKACCFSANDSVYQMEPLSNDDSKKLLYDRIFGSVSGCPHEYEQVSIDILKKCGGVPLVILTTAGMLASDHQVKPDEWHVLLSSIGHGLIQDPCWEEMLRVLSFSYYELPPHLKTCLLYLSIFPWALPIIRDRLVKKLVVEGIVTQETKLIGSPNKNEARLSREISREEVARQYLDELVNRNVIHPLKCNNHGEVISYHIHPMMHGLLKTIAIEENFAALVDLEHSSEEYSDRLTGSTFPQVSINCPDSENQIDLSIMPSRAGVRSLTIFGHANRTLFRYFEGIRLLDLEGCKSIERADVEYICSMYLLKWLCLAKTQITDLPPEIGNLQCLEGLDVGGTQISQLPPQIGKLLRLKTLDARKSRIQEIPDQVVRLTGLVHLLIGDNESCEGVKLPDGFGKMASLEQLGTIDLMKCSASSLEELAEIPHLKEIAVVGSDDPEDTRIKNAFFSFLNKSIKQRSLVVYTDFRVNTLQSSSPNKYLNYWKKHTMLRFLKVPICIAGQHLRMLHIRVCKLEEDDVKILQGLPRLQCLIVRLELLPTKMIHISCEGFAKLESFYVDCRMPRVIFEEGAMPKLDRLELKLYAGSASDEHMGINHLRNLQKVTLRYSKWYAANKGVRETTETVKTECMEHQNQISLCVAEEDKDGNCTMETEIFQENRVASSTKMTEIAEEEDTQEGGRTSEIEEVVE